MNSNNANSYDNHNNTTINENNNDNSFLYGIIQYNYKLYIDTCLYYKTFFFTSCEGKLLMTNLMVMQKNCNTQDKNLVSAATSVYLLPWQSFKNKKHFDCQVVYVPVPDGRKAWVESTDSVNTSNKTRH